MIKRRYWVMLILALLVAWTARADAQCKVYWVDHDYNTFTPAIKVQICDRTTDVRAIPQPSVRPIQIPKVRPVRKPRVSPIGTSSCRKQHVYENGDWVTRTLCR